MLMWVLWKLGSLLYAYKWNLLLCMGAVAGNAVVTYVGSAYMATYLMQYAGYSPSLALWLVTSQQILGGLLFPVSGIYIFLDF